MGVAVSTSKTVVEVVTNEESQQVNVSMPITNTIVALTGGIMIPFGSNGKVHEQSVASSTWTIQHNLGKKPGGILVIDTAGDIWEPASVEYINENILILDFNGLVFSGTAYIS